MAAIQIPTTAFKQTTSVEQQWTDLYNEYRNENFTYQTQAWYLIAECKINRNMTPQATREWMAQNYHFAAIDVNWAKCKEQQTKQSSIRRGMVSALRQQVSTVDISE